jgi:hypothetical protein
MKRSKIFLGATTCFLAIAGIAATKAHRTLTNAYTYDIVGNKGHCVPIQSLCRFKSGATPACLTSVGGQQIFTAKASPFVCNNLLTYTVIGTK